MVKPLEVADVKTARQVVKGQVHDRVVWSVDWWEWSAQWRLLIVTLRNS